MTLQAPNVKREGCWQIAGGGELVVRRGPVANSGTVAYVVTEDHMGTVKWRVFYDPAVGVCATQVVQNREDWNHFLDSLNQDVSPYVHAAVARLVAELAGLPVTRLNVSEKVKPAPGEMAWERNCLSCHAFRRLPGGDIVLGDAEGYVPSRSTGQLREEGPWVAEAYLCAAQQEVPEDVERLVDKANLLARHGDSSPVLPLDRAGEGCPLYLPKGTGRKGGYPAYKVPAGYADEPYKVEREGVVALRVRGTQWIIELPVKTQ